MAAANAYFDPLHILRPPGAHDTYDSESRFAMPGMILANTADHAVVGTSIVQDFDEAYYKGKTGQDIARYLLTGGTAYEQRRMIETLLTSDTPPKTIIWGIAPTSFFTSELDSIRWSQFPEYLFTKNPSALQYVFSFQTFYRLLRQLPARLNDQTQTAAQRFTTDTNAMPLGRDHIYKTYCGPLKDERIARLGEYDYTMIEAQIMTNMIPVITAHPDTQFILFFPPYSLVQFIEFDKAKALGEVFRFRTAIAQSVKDIPNVTLYDFGSDQTLISDDDDHRDSIHYGAKTTRAMIDDIQTGKNKITNDDIERKNAQLKKLIENRRDQIWRDIDAYCARN
jgi:hypothetical protein